ncbi:hypothetical protein ACET3Z_032794 [Daucus carota]
MRFIYKHKHSRYIWSFTISFVNLCLNFVTILQLWMKEYCYKINHREMASYLYFLHISTELCNACIIVGSMCKTMKIMLQFQLYLKQSSRGCKSMDLKEVGKFSART